MRSILISPFFQHLDQLLTHFQESLIKQLPVALQHSWLLPTGALQQLLDQGQVGLLT